MILERGTDGLRVSRERRRERERANGGKGTGGRHERANTGRGGVVRCKLRVRPDVGGVGGVSLFHKHKTLT